MADFVCFYDRSIRLWTFFAVDTDGYQLWDVQYFVNKEDLADGLANY